MIVVVARNTSMTTATLSANSAGVSRSGVRWTRTTRSSGMNAPRLLRLGIGEREVVVPGPIEPLQRLVQRLGVIGAADLADDLQAFQLGQGVANLEIHFQIGVSFQIQLDVIVELLRRPAFRRRVFPQTEVGQKRLSTFLFLGFIEQTHQYSGVVV